MTNDWGLTYNITYHVPKSRKRENEREAFSVKLCPKCNIVYEMTFNQYKKQNNIYYQVYFSGTGFHLGIPGSAFRWKPAPNLHLMVKDELMARGVYEYADVSVSDKTRLIRVVNTMNKKSNLWKIPLLQSELHKPITEIQALAKMNGKY